MIELIKPMFEQNISLSTIAKEMGTSQATISRLCKKHGLKRKSIISIANEQDIIELTKQNMSTYEIAAKLKVSPQTIHERQIKLNINRRLHTLTEEIADKNRKHYVDLSHFERLDNIGSYWLGALYADGSVYQSKAKQPYRISLGLAKKDEEWLNQYRLDIGLKDTYEIKDYTNKHGNKSVRVSLSNMHFAKLLWSYGLDPRNKNYKTKPPAISYLKDFIRGLLDGDGYCCIKKNRKARNFLDIGIYFEKKELAQKLLLPIKNQSGVLLNGPYQTKNIWIIKTSHRKAIKFAEWLWNNPTRCLNRKNLIESFKISYL